MSHWWIALLLWLAAPAVIAEQASQAEVLFLQGQVGSVAQLCPADDLSRRLQPEEERACLLSVRSLNQQRAFAAARQRIERLQQARGSSEWRAALQLALADGYFLEGNWIAAQQAYQTATDMARRTPLYPLPMYGWARATLYVGERDRARALLTDVVRLAPWSFEAESAREILNDDVWLAIQVGAFHARGNAVKLLHELQRQDYPVYVQDVAVGGRTHFRVRVGRLGSYADARRVQAELDRLGYPTRIVP